jgi:protein associated with RNAse G/E
MDIVARQFNRTKIVQVHESVIRNDRVATRVATSTSKKWQKELVVVGWIAIKGLCDTAMYKSK